MYFRKALDKTKVTPISLGRPFQSLVDNKAVMEAINEILDAKSVLPRLEQYKGTSKSEFGDLGIALLTGGGNLLSGLFRSKIPLGYDRLVDFLGIWAVLITAARASKPLLRWALTKSNPNIKKLLNENLTIEIYKVDKNNNISANQTIDIGSIEKFLDNADDVIDKAMLDAGVQKAEIPLYNKHFDTNSVEHLKNAYEAIKKIDSKAMKLLTAAGIGGGLFGSGAITSTLRKEPTDTIIPSPETKRALPPKGLTPRIEPNNAFKGVAPNKR